MLRGRFDNSGAPYVRGRLLLPRLRIDSHGSHVSFLVDTGADGTVLMPSDGAQIGVDYTTLGGAGQYRTIGGASSGFMETALVAFSEARRLVHVYAIQLLILEPSSDVVDLLSLLGRDVINHWHMSMNYSKLRLTFRVLSADAMLPLT